MSSFMRQYRHLHHLYRIGAITKEELNENIDHLRQNIRALILETKKNEQGVYEVIT
jgi:hypothetical protein